MTQTDFRPGDKVECRLADVKRQAAIDRDEHKAKKRRVGFFMGKASVYMHPDEAYVVVGITKTGGLRLRGFVPTVSPEDVQPSTRPIYR